MNGWVAKIRQRLFKPSQRSLRSPEPIYSDDIFFVSYPRSGSAWLRRLVGVALKPQASEEVRKNIEAVIPDLYVVGRRLRRYPRPRMIKSHESYQPRYPKVVYLYRDGRDVALSYYNFYQTVKAYEGSLDEFLGLYIKGAVDFGAWDDHVRSWLLREISVPRCAVSYEDLHRNTVEVLASVLRFLGHSAPLDAIRKAVADCTFASHQEYVRDFSPNYGTGYRGGVGGKAGHWREKLSQRQLGMLWDAMGPTLEAAGYRRES
jgi:hypothetical protein